MKKQLPSARHSMDVAPAEVFIHQTPIHYGKENLFINRNNPVNRLRYKTA
jgi:hypothetical protein